MAAANFLASLLVGMLSLAPFPGAVQLCPLLAGVTAYLAFGRRNGFILAAAAMNLVAPWLAPPSIREETFFDALVAAVVVCAMMVLVGQFRGLTRRL